jgi:hypothetical protein
MSTQLPFKTVLLPDGMEGLQPIAIAAEAFFRFNHDMSVSLDLYVKEHRSSHPGGPEPVIRQFQAQRSRG